MHDFPPNVDWRLTTALATTLGYLITDDFTSLEQIAIANWILQVGQTVITNATFQHLIEARIIGEERINLNSKEYKRGGSPFIDNSRDYREFFTNEAFKEQFELLQKAIEKISNELNNIKKGL